MNTARVAIDAMGNSTGGGRAVLDRCIERALAHPHLHARVFCTRPQDLAVRWRTHPRVTPHPVARAAGALGRVWWYTQGLREAVDQGVDVVLSLNAMGAGRPPQVNLLQQPMIEANDGLARQPLRFVQRMMMVRALTTASCQRAQAVVAQTPSMARVARRELGVPPDAVHVLTPDVPWPIDCHEARSDHVILYVGHDEPYKNVAGLVEAVALARRTHPGLRLVTTTRAPQAPSWWQSVGPQGPRALRRLYATSTLLVLPSLTETVGLPMLEAMAAGLPVLASDRSFARDVCGARNAHFVDTQDARATARAITALIDAPDQRAQLAARGLQRVQALQDARPYEQLIELLLQHT